MNRAAIERCVTEAAQGRWAARMLLVAGLAMAGCVGDLADRPARPHGAARGPMTCEAPSVGGTPVRRLTQAQYGYSVLDLLGLDALTSEEAQRLSTIADGAVGRFQGSGGLVDSEVARTYLTLAEALSARAVASGAIARWHCDPSQPDCLRGLVERVGGRAFRRPLTRAEVDAYLALHAEIRATDGDPAALESVLTAMLSSPRFLYRLEPIDAREARGEIAPIGEHALAARLSYFLWSSLPDQELLDLATAGRLSEPLVYEAQVRRLLADRRFERTLDQFHTRWLQLDALAAIGPSDPAWSEDLRGSLGNETLAFVSHVLIEGDGRLETLLTASFTFGDARLAEHYGAPPPDASGRIELDPSQRAGVLTHAGLLAQFGQSHPEIFRGLFIRDALLCDRPSPPPANIVLDPSVNRLEVQPCAGCHSQMDPIGFGFADYDSLGRFRPGNRQTAGTTDDANLAPSSATREPELVGHFEGPRELAERLAASERTSQCMVLQWLRYAHGRSETREDTCQITELRERFVAAGGDIRELLFAIATSEEFRARAVADLSDSGSELGGGS